MVTAEEPTGGHNGSVIVDCALYHHGMREVSPEDSCPDALDDRPLRGERASSGSGCTTPTEAELDQVAEEFALHPLAVEDALKAHQRPKVEEYADSLFVVLKTVRYDEETQQIELGDVMLFVGDSFVVTVRHGKGRALADVRERLEAQQGLLDCGPSAVLYAIADRIVDDYTAIALEVEEDIEEVEERVFSPERSNGRAASTTSSARSSSSAARCCRSSSRWRGSPSGEVPHVARADAAVLPRHRRPRRAGVASRSRASTTCWPRSSTRTWPRSRSSRTRTCAGSRPGWPSRPCPPLIAGIYGMNFDHMPELGWRFGYPAVAGVDGGDLRRALPRVQAQRLALTASRPCGRCPVPAPFRPGE